MGLIRSKAEKIAEDILSLDDKILLASIRDWRGDSLAVKSRESFEERFRVNRLAGSMLLPLPSHEVLIGLVLERSPDTQEEEEGGYHIANNIERLMADTS